MNEPRRYLDDDGSDPIARALVGSASDDGLDQGEMAALARALGLGASAVPVPVAAAPLASPPGPLAGGAKWAIGAIVAGALLGGALFVTRDLRPSPVAKNAAPQVVTAPIAPKSGAPADDSARAKRTPADEPSAPATISVTALPEAPLDPARAPSRLAPANAGSTTSSAAPAASGDLTAELAALERVRVAIAEHRVADARAGLDRYDRSFPTKILQSEARVLEIETLLAEGRRTEGEARARAFLASSPGSAYATRVRSLLASAQGGGAR